MKTLTRNFSTPSASSFPNAFHFALFTPSFSSTILRGWLLGLSAGVALTWPILPAAQAWGLTALAGAISATIFHLYFIVQSFK